MIYNNFYYSKDFLEALDNEKTTFTYAKAILLDKDNVPLDNIEGLIVSGSVNIDGSSSMRRTCSLQIKPRDEDINSFNWVFKDRIQLYLGRKNTLKKKFPQYSHEDIIWFNQGYYIITDFNSSINAQGIVININAKDKMCLLNGEVNGIIEAQTIFSEKEIVTMNKVVAPILDAASYRRNKYYVYRNGHSAEAVLKAGQKKIIVGYEGELIEFKTYLATGEEVITDAAIDEENHQVLFKIRKTYSRDIHITVLYQQYIEFTAENKTQKCECKELTYAVLYNADKTSITDVDTKKFNYNDETKSFIYCGEDIADGNFIRAYYDCENYYLSQDIYNPYETYYKNEEEITKKLVPIREIIMGLMTEYAHEKPQNIIINDLDDYGLKLMQYVGDSDFYAIKEKDANVYINITSDPNLPVKVNTTNTVISKLETYNQLGDGLKSYIDSGTIFTFGDDSQEYTAARIQYGQRVGYNLTDLVYSGDLIANAGDTYSSVLDKIISMLSEFEYFYDENGRFIFQKKPVYIDIVKRITDEKSIHNIDGSQIGANLANLSPYEYNFKNYLISSIQNNPNLSNIFNDYVIWGERQGVESNIPIHIRYAIDVKPSCYQTLKLTKDDAEMYKQLTDFEGELTGYIKESKFYCTNNYPQSLRPEEAIVVDWREIIYQMANDFFKAHYFDDFEWRLQNTNKGLENVIRDGRTGYEDYYRDVFGFWRELYSLESEEGYSIANLYTEKMPEEQGTEYNIKFNKEIVGQCNSATISNGAKVCSDSMYGLSLINSDYIQIVDEAEKYGNYWYYPIKVNEIQYAPNKYYIQSMDNNITAYKLDSSLDYNDSTVYYERFSSFFSKEDLYDDNHWRKDIVTNPDKLNFWIDFVEGNPEIMEYSVRKIGSKKKVVNNNKAGMIYEADPPTLIFITPGEEERDTTKTGYTYIELNDFTKNDFNISPNDLTVYDVLNQNLQDFIYAKNSISISCLPIYYLQPNTKITIDNKNLKTNGNYILERISYSFGNANNMSITATLIPPRII